MSPLQTAADALLAYAFGRDEDGALPGTMADAVAVRSGTPKRQEHNKPLSCFA